MLKFVVLWLLFALPAAQASEARVFGAAMPAGAAQPIADARIDPAAATPGKFSGRIVEVCQAKGCWLMLEDGGRAARVMMKDHAFSVPKDASGAAIVFGTLSEKTLDAKTARHLAEDAGREEPVPTQELRIEALSVEWVGG